MRIDVRLERAPRAVPGVAYPAIAVARNPEAVEQAAVMWIEPSDAVCKQLRTVWAEDVVKDLVRPLAVFTSRIIVRLVHVAEHRSVSLSELAVQARFLDPLERIGSSECRRVRQPCDNK
jgi:hypothetical protein